MSKLDTILQRFPGIAKEAAQAIYQAGWNDAAARIVALAKREAGIIEVLPTTVDDTDQKLAAPPNGAARSNIDVTLGIIKASPGMKGAAVIKQVQRHFPDVDPQVVARTTRTSFSRLHHKRGVIEQRNSRWYPVKEAIG